MKIIGRILIILAVFSMVAGLMVTVVNASGVNAPDLGGAPQFRPEGNAGGFRPEGDGNRPGGRDGFGGSPRWLLGSIKNVGVIALLVTVIVWPRSVTKKNKRRAVVQASHGEK